MKQRYPIFLLGSIILVTAGILFVVLNIQNKKSSVKDLPQTSELAEIKFQPNTSRDNLVDVFLRLKSGEERYFMSLENVYIDHLHPAEYHNGNLYVIRRVNFQGYFDPEDDWADELWKYNSQKEGSRLYTERGIDFRVSPDERFIAVSSADRTQIIILEDNQNQQRFAAQEIAPQIDLGENSGFELLEWYQDELWGKTDRFSESDLLFVILPATGEIQRFDLPSFEISPRDFALNYAKKLLAFSNYPVFGDAQEHERFLQSDTKVELQILNLTDNTIRNLATSRARPFNPRWIGANILEYDDPDKDGAVLRETI